MISPKHWSDKIPAPLLAQGRHISYLIAFLALTLQGGCLGTEVGNGLKPPRGKDKNSSSSGTTNPAAKPTTDSDVVSDGGSESLQPLLTPLELMELMTNTCANPLAHATLGDTRLHNDAEEISLELEFRNESWVVSIPGSPTLTGHVKFLADGAVDSRVEFNGVSETDFDTTCRDVSSESQEDEMTKFAATFTLASRTVQARWTILESSNGRTLTELEVQSETGQNLIKLRAD